MKPQVKIETTTTLFDQTPLAPQPKPSGLKWDIQVEVNQSKLKEVNFEQPLVVDKVESMEVNQVKSMGVSQVKSMEVNQVKSMGVSQVQSIEVNQVKSVEVNQMSSVEMHETKSLSVMSTKSSKSNIVIKNTPRKKSSIVVMKETAPKKSPMSAAEERKLSKLMNPRGRKVSRQGDWLVFTERVGLLTSQNGVQTVTEERVRINADDLTRLKSLGF